EESSLHARARCTRRTSANPARDADLGSQRKRRAAYCNLSCAVGAGVAGSMWAVVRAGSDDALQAAQRSASQSASVTARSGPCVVVRTKTSSSVLAQFVSPTRRSPSSITLFSIAGLEDAVPVILHVDDDPASRARFV